MTVSSVKTARFGVFNGTARLDGNTTFKRCVVSVLLRRFPVEIIASGRHGLAQRAADGPPSSPATFWAVWSMSQPLRQCGAGMA